MPPRNQQQTAALASSRLFAARAVASALHAPRPDRGKCAENFSFVAQGNGRTAGLHSPERQRCSPRQECTMTPFSVRHPILALAGALGVAAVAALAAAETRLKMVLNWKYQGPQGWFFLSDDRGYFKAEGLEVAIDQGDGSAAAVPKVASGAHDLCFGG